MEERINELKEYEKVFLAHKIFDIWQEGKIMNKDILFLPRDVKINNPYDVSKILLVCSKINKSEKISKIITTFLSLEFYEKLDIMSYLFTIINDLSIIPNKITNTMDFKILGSEIQKYKHYI